MVDIAKLFGDKYKHVNALSTYCKISYIKIRNEMVVDDYISGKTITELVEKYNITRSTVYRILDSNGLDRKKKRWKFSVKKRDFLKTLKKLNFSVKKVAKHYKVSESTIRSYVRKDEKIMELLMENNMRSANSSSRTGIVLKDEISNYVDEHIILMPNKFNRRANIYNLLEAKFSCHRDYIRKIVLQKEKQWAEKNQKTNKE